MEGEHLGKNQIGRIFYGTKSFGSALHVQLVKILSGRRTIVRIIVLLLVVIMAL